MYELLLLLLRVGVVIAKVADTAMGLVCEGGTGRGVERGGTEREVQGGRYGEVQGGRYGGGVEKEIWRREVWVI